MSLIIGITFFTNSMGIAEIGFGESDIFPLDLSKKPAILSVVPQSGSIGTRITIIGEGFMTGFVEGTIVKIGGNIVTNVEMVSTIELKAKIPPMSAGEVDIVVTIPYGESATLEKAFVSEEVFTIQNNVYPWDVNNDGVVDISDLALVGSQFGETGEDIVGDVNSDDVVNIADFEMVGNHFGEKEYEN